MELMHTYLRVFERVKRNNVDSSITWLLFFLFLHSELSFDSSWWLQSPVPSWAPSSCLINVHRVVFYPLKGSVALHCHALNPSWGQLGSDGPSGNILGVIVECH